MEDLVFMAESSSLQELEHEAPDDFGVESTTIAILIHILLQILLAKLEDENELCLAVDDIVQANDVGVFELFHQGDLTDCCGRCPLLGIQVNFLEGHDLVGSTRPTLKAGSAQRVFG